METLIKEKITREGCHESIAGAVGKEKRLPTLVSSRWSGGGGKEFWELRRRSKCHVIRCLCKSMFLGFS